MKEKSNNKGLYVVIGTLCVAIIALTIAYAALSANLQINFGTVTQYVQSWNVHFVGSSATGTPSSAGTDTSGVTCGAATITDSSVTIAATTISRPGDKCTYPLTVKNDGTIDAILNSITPQAPSSTECSTASGATLICGNIKYRLTTDAAGSTVLTSPRDLGKNNSSDPSDTLNLYLIAEYNPEASSLNNSSAIVQTGAGFTLNYAQK